MKTLSSSFHSSFCHWEGWNSIPKDKLVIIEQMAEWPKLNNHEHLWPQKETFCGDFFLMNKYRIGFKTKSKIKLWKEAPPGSSFVINRIQTKSRAHWVYPPTFQHLTTWTTHAWNSGFRNRTTGHWPLPLLTARKGPRPPQREQDQGGAWRSVQV